MVTKIVDLYVEKSWKHVMNSIIDLATLIPPDEMNPVKPKQEQHESRLLHYLLTNYNRQVRPLLDHSGNITVSVGITLTQIFDMVSHYQWL